AARRFQTEQAAPDDDRLAVRFRILDQPAAILKVSKGGHIRLVGPRQRKHERQRARCDNQLVIGGAGSLRSVYALRSRVDSYDSLACIQTNVPLLVPWPAMNRYVIQRS